MCRLQHGLLARSLQTVDKELEQAARIDGAGPTQVFWNDSIPGLIVTAAVSAYGIFLFRQAIMSAPNEIIDAGRMDGCSEFGIYHRLVMPLVKPMSAAFCMFVFLAQWNAFFAPNIIIQISACSWPARCSRSSHRASPSLRFRKSSSAGSALAL